MINDFKIDFDNAEFEFKTMNAVHLQLFQVYVMDEGQKRRFHMQANEQGNFYITDKQACPQKFHHLETTFSDAILRLGKK